MSRMSDGMAFCVLAGIGCHISLVKGPTSIRLPGMGWYALLHLYHFACKGIKAPRRFVGKPIGTLRVWEHYSLDPFPCKKNHDT
jgi:hypothetical protein